jgi:hypothetical protein
MDERTEARFWAKVNKTETCWLWTGAKFPTGYGHWRRSEYAHRVAYALAIGPIPAGMQIDHTCHNGTECLGGSSCPHRACVNPAHLEAVTQAVNIARGNANLQQKMQTHCRNGHPFDQANTYHHPRGQRVCRICTRESGARYRAAREEARAS